MILISPLIYTCHVRTVIRILIKFPKHEILNHKKVEQATTQIFIHLFLVCTPSRSIAQRKLAEYQDHYY